MFSVLSVSIYYETLSDIRVKSFCGLHLLRTSVYNFENLDILLLFLISSVTIYNGTQLDIQVKSYCHFNFLGTSVFNFKRLDILRDSFGHPS